MEEVYDNWSWWGNEVKMCAALLRAADEEHRAYFKGVLGLWSNKHPKVRTFWETHKIRKNLPHALDIYLVNVQNIRKIFSESSNFTSLDITDLITLTYIQ